MDGGERKERGEEGKKNGESGMMGRGTEKEEGMVGG